MPPKPKTEEMNDITVAPPAPTLAAALCAIIREAPSLAKDAKNAFANYAYVPIDGYYEVLAKVMAKHGVTFITREVDFEIIETMAASEKRGRGGDEPQRRVFTKTTYEFDVFFTGLTEDALALASIGRITVLHGLTGPQTAGSSMSYAEKVFFRTFMKAVTGEKDGDAEEPQDVRSVQGGPNAGFGAFEAKPEPKQEPKAAPKAEVKPEPKQEAPQIELPDELKETFEKAKDALKGVEKQKFPVFKADADSLAVAGWEDIAFEVFRVFVPTFTRTELREFWEANGQVLRLLKEGDGDAVPARPDIYSKISALFTERLNYLKSKGE